ncbi:MAG: D-amino acid dehydrogenase [Betaproteobacteria bacterium]
MPVPRVCVIGAGIVGCATAHLLAKAGHRVTLLDAAAGPGLGATMANGAQLSYSYVEPLATPATLRKMPALLLDRGSPLRFRLTGEPEQLRWGLRFLRACTAAQAQRATAALLALAELSRSELHAAVAADGLRFDHAQPGKLVVYDSAAGLAGARRQVELQLALGCTQQVLTHAQCLEREPALAAYAEHIAGGVWTPGEEVADPLRLAGELAERAARYGAELRWRCAATGFVRRGERIVAVKTATGEVETDAVVLANGAAAARLGRALGLRLPVYPLKGYSITVPVADPARAPRVSVTDLRRKIVYAPLAGTLRVAGMAELVGHDLRIDARRIRQLTDAVAETFPGAGDLNADLRPWAGLRPATPTSMPIVGAAGAANAYLNVGHGALGLTLALGSARLVQQLLAGLAPRVAAPFAWRR